jgi:uncharacterized protein YcnI
MKCSAWSSRAISACSALAAALAVAGTAFAGSHEPHVSVDPERVLARRLAELVFTVPNVSDGHGVDHVTFGFPPGFVLTDAEAKPGWSQSRAGQAVTWSGGRIPKGEFGRFAIRGYAPAKAVRALFNVLVGDSTGKSTTYRVGVEVAAHEPHDESARSLARTALIVAAAAAALALATGFFALSLWRRPPP